MNQTSEKHRPLVSRQQNVFIEKLLYPLMEDKHLGKFIETLEDGVKNYLSGAFLPSTYSTASYAAVSGAFGMNYLEVLNQQLQLFPRYRQSHYPQIRHYIVDKMAAFFSAHPNDFVEGDLGEIREPFKRLDEIL